VVVLKDGENVLLVPPKNPQALCDAIVSLYKNRDLWKKLSESGRLFVENNICWEKYAEAMFDCFVNCKK
jgi:glycosyltransferase involved in cell wall biosynthesis